MPARVGARWLGGRLARPRITPRQRARSQSLSRLAGGSELSGSAPRPQLPPRWLSVAAAGKCLRYREPRILVRLAPELSGGEPPEWSSWGTQQWRRLPARGGGVPAACGREGRHSRACTVS